MVNVNLLDNFAKNKSSITNFISNISEIKFGGFRFVNVFSTIYQKLHLENQTNRFSVDVHFAVLKGCIINLRIWDCVSNCESNKKPLTSIIVVSG